MKNREVKIDDAHIVEEILQRRRSGAPSGPTIPADRVSKFLELLGKEIKNGELRKEDVDRLVQQLKDGVI